jgi:hypothetical protein
MALKEALNILFALNILLAPTVNVNVKIVLSGRVENLSSDTQHLKTLPGNYPFCGKLVRISTGILFEFFGEGNRILLHN